MTYFIRVNGNTLHNNPDVSRLYVPGESPRYPETYFNGLNYCFSHNIVRIGWPGYGDMRKPDRVGALSKYTNSEFTSKQQEYLRNFADILEGSTIVMPDAGNPGDVYLGIVNAPYHYFHDVPLAPYEYSHRLGVKWMRNGNGDPIRFFAHELDLSIAGGVIWPRAFAILDESPSGRTAIRLISAQIRKAVS